MGDLLPWEKALEDDLGRVPVMPAQTTPVEESLGLALAEPVVSREAMPPFDNSAMDGFAVRAEDLAGAGPGHPVTLPLGENLPAGVDATEALAPGSAARVMTGAPLPPGADAVVPVEATDAWDSNEGRINREARGSITFFQEPRPGQHIRRAGESVAPGSTVLKPGHVLGGPELALLLSIGERLVTIHSLPRVAVLSTGDELVPPDQTPGPAQIRDSNRPGLLAGLKRLGFPTLDLGLVQDDPQRLEQVIRDNLSRLDFLITSGGVSVGDRDFTRDVLNTLGRVSPRKVAMKPGKPQVVGDIEGKPVFGLPGNPVSSLVVFDVFVLPMLRRMSGFAEPRTPRFEATLTEGIRHAQGRSEFVRVSMECLQGGWTATPTGPQGSGILGSMTRANGYAIIPRETGNMESGATVLCMPMASRL